MGITLDALLKITCKNYSFYGNRNNIASKFDTMVEIFPNCDAKQLQELKENAGNANTKKSTKTWLGQSGLKKKDTARTL